MLCLEIAISLKACNELKQKIFQQGKQNPYGRGEGGVGERGQGQTKHSF